MDGTEEVAGRLVIARSNGAVLLGACEDVLDQVPRLIKVARGHIHGAACSSSVKE